MRQNCSRHADRFITIWSFTIHFCSWRTNGIGISNEEKAKHRRDYAEGKIGRAELLKAESASYHSAGTCTFYGTANSNQMLMEMLGLHLPGASFITPGTPLREALNDFAVKRLKEITYQGDEYTPLFEVITEESIVNALVGLVATGGSTNHTLHLIAIARAAGIIIDWTDFNHISEAVPSIVRVYPNGTADINHFQACGGMGYLVKTLLNGGFLHADVKTIMGSGMEAYTKEPYLEKGALRWRSSPKDSLDQDVLRSVENPFSPTGGLKILKGNLGRSVIKISAVKAEHHVINAPAQVFTNQSEVVEAFKRKELNRDVIVVVKNQGPQANGMPELHKLTPCLSILQNQGFKVALVTDGRMSGASGKVPAAIHLSPESLNGGPIHKVRSGDMLELNAAKGTLNCLESDFEMREASSEVSAGSFGVGRELFNQLRPALSLSEEGASFVI